MQNGLVPWPNQPLVDENVEDNYPVETTFAKENVTKSKMLLTMSKLGPIVENVNRNVPDQDPKDVLMLVSNLVIRVYANHVDK